MRNAENSPETGAGKPFESLTALSETEGLPLAHLFSYV
ncbi:unnamed protein product, partial [marine sediment metagenome]